MRAGETWSLKDRLNKLWLELSEGTFGYVQVRVLSDKFR